jgi:hypothetical protein
MPCFNPLGGESGMCKFSIKKYMVARLLFVFRMYLVAILFLIYLVVMNLQISYMFPNKKLMACRHTKEGQT